MKALLRSIALVSILAVAAVLRFQHLDWDRGYLFHPDERQILLVASTLSWPTDATQFFSPDSPLNPKFFAYGSLPIYLARLIEPLAPATDLPSPWQDDRFVGFAFAARAIAALMDLLTLCLLIYLGKLLYDWRAGLVAGAAYAVSALPIQVAHFYTVDPLLTLLTVAAFVFLSRYALGGRRLDLWGMGVFYGLALATKVSALPLLMPMLYSIVLVAARNGRRARRIALNSLRSTVPRWLADMWSMLREPLFESLSLALLAFLIVQPYALIDFSRYTADVWREMLLARGWLDVPFTRQYLNTPPFLYLIQQSATWGLGLPLGILAWGGALLLAWQWVRAPRRQDGLLLLWAVTFFGTVGGQQTKYVRYLLPLLPFLLLMAVRSLLQIADWSLASVSRHSAEDRLARGVALGLIGLGLVGGLGWSLAFLSIYSEEHPWLQASAWIYSHVPQGSTLLSEQWDDTLPVLILDGGKRKEATAYKVLQAPVFDPDDSAKLAVLVDRLIRADYVTLTSPRAAAVLPRLPLRYPLSTNYYEGLFDGSLGFEPVLVIHPVPRLGPLAFRDDPFAGTGVLAPLGAESARELELGRADESLTVYDHPYTTVLQKKRSLSPEELRLRLTGAK